MRVIELILTILVIATINFMLVYAATVMAGQSGATDEKFLVQVRAECGLDKSYIVQLGTYLNKVMHFDLGYSFRQRREVSSLILERLGPTLLLTLSALVVSIIGGITFRTIAGIRNGRWSDTLIHQ